MIRPLLATLLLAAPPAAISASPAYADAGISTFIVTLDEAPLAVYRGFEGEVDSKRAGLKATSPEVTGAPRLDMKSAAVREYRAWLSETRELQIQEWSRALGRTLTPTLTFDVVNHAVLLELTAGEAERLRGLAGVAQVEEEFVHRPMTDAGPTWIGANQLWSGVDGVSTRGEGVVVGVIDSGVNQSHPSFAALSSLDGFVHSNPRNRFYGLCETTPTSCNAKLIGNYDFTLCTGVHASTGCDDREPNLGLSQDLHGAHVASTVVGNPLQTLISIGNGSVMRTISGVAPRANLITYKACEEEEDCRGSWLLAAINQAVADGVAVINYSIGGGPRDPWTASDATAMLNARSAGVVVVVAAGNSGPGAGTVSSPGNAPWVIGVANATHDRAIVNRLVDLSGGNTPPPSGGVLLGAGSTAGYGPANIVIPLDFPGCSIGTNPDSPPSGVSNPWTTPVFNGEIVVCARGVQARVAKSNNVRLAGGGGMVLTNSVAEGEGIVADAHSIPSTHVGFEAGSALRQWLASGSGHRGRLEGAQLRNEAEVADILAASSGRGPSFVANVLKPNVTAPGTSVLAAGGTGNSFAFLSGTSMATPHIAGTVALLRAARPNWSVSAIESAIQATALSVVRNSSRTGIADPFEQGGGRVSVVNALRAGLSFEVGQAEMLAANPAQGGQPKSLNQPAVVDAQCLERCSFSRSVRDLNGGGRWQVLVELPTGARATVTPSDFVLSAGGSQTLQIELDVSDPRLAGQWISGALRLRKIDGPAASDTRITVHAFASPGAFPRSVSTTSAADRSVRDFALNTAIALPDLSIEVTTLMEATRRSETLVADPTNSEAYDSFGTGTFFTLVIVPASTAPSGSRLEATLTSITSPDVDLFVGLDSDGDGQPDEFEELCVSALPDSFERCIIDVAPSPVSQTYWVLAQNFRTGPSGSDAVNLTTSLVELKHDPASALTVTGPSSVARQQTFPLRAAVDAPRSAMGSQLIGYVGLRAVPDAPKPFIWMQVDVARGSDPLSARTLVPGRALELRLPAGQAGERLFIDVPSNASGLSVSSSSSGEIDLFAARSATPSSPTIDAAPPRAQAAASATGPGGNHTLSITGASLSPGRWYLTPVNTGTTDALLTLTANLSYTAPRAQPRFGAYFDPARDGAGVFLFSVGESWALAWYTYLEDGTPTWYLGAAPRPGPTQGHWLMDLLRYRWNGSEAIPTRVGEIQLSLNGSENLSFSWSLDAASGSQRLQWIGDTRCPLQGGSPLDVAGVWFSPDRPGFGYSVIASPAIDNVGAYFYDGNGVARWALGGVTPFGASSIPLDWRVGSCPLCAYLPPVRQIAVGTLQRSYSSATSGRFALDFPLPSPTTGRWQIDMPAARFSDASGCQ